MNCLIIIGLVIFGWFLILAFREASVVFRCPNCRKFFTNEEVDREKILGGSAKEWDTDIVKYHCRNCGHKWTRSIKMAKTSN